MGLNCTCLRDQSTEENQIRLNTSGHADPIEPKKHRKHKKKKRDIQINLDDAIKLQGVLRGYIERRKAKEIYHTTKSGNLKRNQKSNNTVVRSSGSNGTNAKRATTF
ncbi:unnamed protein product [Blepharisma stoltei]|uniref:Uncharacterized protein n=1 Tax=Blepharisma stoltei TaxID=1481888 RepID=A0AAU9IYV2_9CILI|nr:unnamed protein product [Blepharisma stoltei]